MPDAVVLRCSRLIVDDNDELIESFAFNGGMKAWPISLCNMTGLKKDVKTQRLIQEFPNGQTVAQSWKS